MQTIFPCWNNGVKSYTDGGEVQCDVCNSFDGIISKNYRRGESKWTWIKNISKCISCGSKEVKNLKTGEILKQERRVKE